MIDAHVGDSPLTFSGTGGEFLFSLLTKVGWHSIIGLTTKKESLLDYIHDGQESITAMEEEPIQGKPKPRILDVPSQPVLIAEDHPWYRKHLDSILTEAGYRCELSGTFEEALRKLNESDPFVLLLDLKLDGEFRKGWNLAEAAVDKGIPTIVITNYPSIEGLNKAIREFGVVYFFDKSRLSPKELIPRVHEVASRFREKKLSRDQRQALFEKLLGFFPDSSA